MSAKFFQSSLMAFSALLIGVMGFFALSITTHASASTDFGYPTPFPGSTDDDYDGYHNDTDPCPTQPGHAYTGEFAALSGCPDTDDDGIPNPADRCPTMYGDTDRLDWRGCSEVWILTFENLSNDLQSIQGDWGEASAPQ